MRRIIALILLSLTVLACTGTPGGGTTGPVPANGPTWVAFTDTDPNFTLGGPITIGRAVEESDITFYNIRWGATGECNVIDVQVAQIIRAGTGDIIYNLPAGTVKPGSAVKLLVFTKNLNGENLDCASVDIINNEPTPEPPVNAPVSVSFTDNDGELTIGGPITITRAVDEFDITHYVLRFGNNGCNVANGYITEIIKTGTNINYQLPQNTAIPVGASQILVYSKNEWGEMADCDNAVEDITNYIAPDPVPPTLTAQGVSWTDTDEFTTVGGTVNITKAIAEEEITTYVVRWGNGSGCNIASGSLIAELPATGSNLTYNFPGGTVKPSSASQILIYTKNAYGEMADCNNVATAATNVIGQWVKFKHGSSGECLQSPSGTGQLFADTCNISNTYQRWLLIGSGSDYKLQNVGSGKCAQYNAPWNFQAENCSGSSYQTMHFGDPSGSWYEISNSYWAGTSCMYSATWGANIEGTLGNCGLGGDIEWQVRRVDETILYTPFLPF